MPWWKVFLHSEGWRLDIGDQAQEYGFYTTRSVFAESRAEAIEAAREDARIEIAPMRHEPGDHEPYMRAERVVESPESGTSAGFVFYRTNKCGEGEEPIKIVADPFSNRMRRLLRRFRLR